MFRLASHPSALTRTITSPNFNRSSRYLAQLATHKTTSVQEFHPYFIPRNTRGNLPVYTDIRNGGTRYLVLLRNVDGNINVCYFYVSYRPLTDTP
jgi:hypothetical protein